MGGCVAPEQAFICNKCGKAVPRAYANNHNCVPQSKRSNVGQQRPVNTFVTPQAPSNITNPFLPFLKPSFPPQPRALQQQLYRGEARQFTNQFIDVKLPIDPERTLFKWSKQKTIYYPVYIKSFRPEIIRYRTFQQKLLWFRLNMEQLRVSWQKGCQTLKVDRGNLVMSSKVGLKNIDLRKQLKIKFDDEVVDDAGGLLRQWMHMFIKHIFSPEIGIFQQCVTDETAYKFIWDNSLDGEFASQCIEVLGVILGKALFDRVSLNCYLNRTILRQICQQTVLMHDTYSFDKDLYKSWKSIIETDGAENLFLTFAESKTHRNGTTQTLDLIKDGRNIEVNDKNKYQYIYEIIQLYCSRSVHKYIKTLLAGIYKVVPPHFLTVFQPHQMEMLLNGPQFIDVKDWKQNTLYKGYKHNDQVITWFWNVVQKYDQKKLANLLHYCTGSTRVPILGFKYLQSNRNTINKFTIEKVGFIKHNPYPKSYTCFNRLELPQYSSMSELQKNLNVVISQEITHFGLG